MTTTWTFPCVPEPPLWHLDFASLQTRFPWMPAMAQCQQEPEWHAEGDVLTHTRMVLEQLCALDSSRPLPPQDRHIVFAAALFHDMAKPQKTRLEEGKLRSKGHARLGAQMARHLCMTDLPQIPFAAREHIVGLVRYHGIPAYFLDRPDPIRNLLTASILCRLDLLCILATADARGRVTRSRDDMPDRIALFQSTAEEHNCLTAPYPFASDHSRVAYFRTPGMRRETDLYHDVRCHVTLMSGLPAAGKDTWVRSHAADLTHGTDLNPATDLPIVSLDDWRTELDIDPGDDQSTVIAAAKDQARGYLRQRRDFIWNATNTSRMLRDSLITLLLDYHARIRIIYCEAPVAVMRDRNARRPKPVPAEVINRLITRLEVPDSTEAHEVVYQV